jgi:two-component system response regulator NreC
MDISLPLMDGLEATRRILKRHPKTRVLVLTQFNDREHVLSSLKAGAAGYLPKETLSLELVSAIHAVSRGDSFLHPSVLGILIEEHVQKAERGPYDQLTDREREVLKLVGEGRTSQEIARLLSTSVKTILHHKMNMMKKLDVHNHVDLVKYAIRNGLADVETLSAGRE